MPYDVNEWNPLNYCLLCKAYTTEVIGVIFYSSCSKKVTLAPAPELFGNLHYDSCLHSENLKAMSILPHEAK